MVLDEWRGAYGDSVDIVCDTAGGICPWGVVIGTDGTELNISAAATVLMVGKYSELSPKCSALLLCYRVWQIRLTQFGFTHAPIVSPLTYAGELRYLHMPSSCPSFKEQKRLPLHNYATDGREETKRFPTHRATLYICHPFEVRLILRSMTPGTTSATTPWMVRLCGARLTRIAREMHPRPSTATKEPVS